MWCITQQQKHFLFRHQFCWVSSVNSSGLKTDLENKLFGQHIASPIIAKAVTGFMRNGNPKKPLVLSLHGPTGTGKNFVSQLIADNIYKKGNISRFLHTFTYQLDFPDASKTETYKVWWNYIQFICLSSVSHVQGCGTYTVGDPWDKQFEH